MPIRFDEGELAPASEVLQFHLGRPQWLIVGSQATFRKKHLLHYLPAKSRCVPCLHEDCPWCPGDLRLNWYLPALWYARERNAWKQGVLTLTSGMVDFLKEPVEGVVWEFERIGKKNGPVRWKRCERVFKPVPFGGFDVVPSLCRVWGMYANMRRRVEMILGDEPKLFDDQASAG